MNAHNCVLVTRRMPSGSLDPLTAAGCTLDIHDALKPMPRAGPLEAVTGRAALLTTLDDVIDIALLDAAGPQLQAVANCAVGTTTSM